MGKTKHIGRGLNLDKQLLPAYEKFVRIYGPIRVQTLALLLVDGLFAYDRENLIDIKSNKGNMGVEKSLYITQNTASLHKHLVGAYGPKRVYNLGLLLLGDLPPDRREYLMSFIGQEADISEMQKAISRVFSKENFKG
jgi:hypothetical protein